MAWAMRKLDGDESLYLAIEETSQPIRLVTHVGSKTPAFASASGRVILASHPPAAVAAMFGGRLLVTPTGRRLNGVAELLAILEEVRERGFAENREETADGLFAASVPIVNDEGVTIAALTTDATTSPTMSSARLKPLRFCIPDLTSCSARSRPAVACARARGCPTRSPPGRAAR